VKLGENLSGKRFALKFVDAMKVEAITKELKILQGLDHENLVKLIDFHSAITYTVISNSLIFQKKKSGV
jgi:serine/threonine protein kinase